MIVYVPTVHISYCCILIFYMYIGIANCSQVPPGWQSTETQRRTTGICTYTSTQRITISIGTCCDLLFKEINNPQHICHLVVRATAECGKYPPFLMTTSTRDDRVHPYHARAFVSRLLQAGCTTDKVLYYENKEGGHGGAADSKQQAYMTVLMFRLF